MSTLPGRTGVIALSLSFAATFGLVLAVAGTAADLLEIPDPDRNPPPYVDPAIDVEPPPPPVVEPMENPRAPVTPSVDREPEPGA
jgi:hypothetical protein